MNKHSRLFCSTVIDVSVTNKQLLSILKFYEKASRDSAVRVHLSHRRGNKDEFKSHLPR